MGRPKGSLNKTTLEKQQAAAGDGPAPDSRNVPTGKPPQASLTEDQQAALFFNHTTTYKKFLERKKTADAEFKNACKLIKAEGTSVEDIKTGIQLESDGGNERLQAEIERKLRVARWQGAAVGTQFSLLDEDRTPSVDKAKADGKRAGLKGESATPPSHHGIAQQNAWLEGHADGQQVLLARVQQQKDRDAKEFDQKPAAEQSNDAERAPEPATA
jgi:hypothetical protein